MTPTDAARHLDLAPDADEATRQRAYRERREALEQKIATAPTPGLKEKYRASLTELEEAYAALQQAAGQDAHLPGLAPDLRDEPAAPDAGAPASPAVAKPAKSAKPAVGSSSKLPLVAALLMIAALLGGGAFWYLQHSALRQAAADDLLGAIDGLVVDAEDGAIAALRARVEALGDGPFDDHRTTVHAAWEAKQAAIAAHAEAQAQQAAATLADRLASAKRQLNALSLRKDAFAETVRQAERQLSDWRSAEREANRANGWQAEYYSLARSGQERVVRWLSQQKVAHPAWLHLTNAEDFHRAENATATAEELAAAKQAIGQLESQASAEREALVHAPLWRWSMQQWFADNREPVRDYLATFPVPEAERAALDASLAYLDEPGEELPDDVETRLTLFEAVVGAHDERLQARRNEHQRRVRIIELALAIAPWALRESLLPPDAADHLRELTALVGEDDPRVTRARERLTAGEAALATLRSWNQGGVLPADADARFAKAKQFWPATNQTLQGARRQLAVRDAAAAAVRPWVEGESLLPIKAADQVRELAALVGEDDPRVTRARARLAVGEAALTPLRSWYREGAVPEDASDRLAAAVNQWQTTEIIRQACTRWMMHSVLPRLKSWRDPSQHPTYAPLIADARWLIAAAGASPPAGFAIYDAVDRLAAALATQEPKVIRTAFAAAIETGRDEPLVRAFAARLPPEFWTPRHVLRGHEDVAIAPDGTWLASGSADNTLRIWDAATGREHHVLQGHEGDVLSVAIAPDGTWLASGSFDNTVRIWDAATGRERHVLRGHRKSVYDVTIAPDGTWLASASYDDKVRIWDAVTGRERHVLRGHPDVNGLAIAPDGRWLAWASSDGTVHIWDAATGREWHVLQGHEAWVRSVAIAPDSTWLASGSSDNTVRIWDAVAGRERHVLRGHEDNVWGVAIAPDGTWLASASRDDTVRIWDAVTGRARHVLRGHGSHVNGIAIAPNGRWLASTSWDGTVRIWDSATGRARHVLRGHESGVFVVAIAPDGTWLASGSTDDAVRIWGPPVPSTDP